VILVSRILFNVKQKKECALEQGHLVLLTARAPGAACHHGLHLVVATVTMVVVMEVVLMVVLFVVVNVVTVVVVVVMVAAIAMKLAAYMN
jgi:hypothetical protein